MWYEIAWSELAAATVFIFLKFPVTTILLLIIGNNSPQIY
jgi:hypothetical protein